ncbi:MAG: DUF2391 family protein [Candidatus Pacearchaeota archaeon]
MAKKESESVISIDFDVHDLFQVIIGATILAVPLGFTQETWDLGANLPLLNIIILMTITLFFISIFTYFHYHRHHIKEDPQHHISRMIKRVFITYVFSFIIVAALLTTIQIAPWTTDSLLAFKRVAIVTLPSALGATISDTIK